MRHCASFHEYLLTRPWSYSIVYIMDYFNARPTYCADNGYTSNRLLDFASHGYELKQEYVQYVQAIAETRQIHRDHVPDPILKSPINGVELLHDDIKLNKAQPITDFDTLTESLEAKLRRNIRTLEDKNCLLMLSGGIDSQLLLALLEDEDIRFDCMHIIMDDTEQQTAKTLVSKYGKKCYFVQDLDMSRQELIDSIKIYNPPTQVIGAALDYQWAKILKSLDLSEYDCIVNGFESAAMLGQKVWPLYAQDTTDFSHLNSQFEYKDWKFDQKQKNYLLYNYRLDHKALLKAKGKSGRNYHVLESAGLPIYSPYASQDILESALALSDDIAIRNVYKDPQIAILKRMNIQPILTGGRFVLYPATKIYKLKCNLSDIHIIWSSHYNANLNGFSKGQ